MNFLFFVLQKDSTPEGLKHRSDGAVFVRRYRVFPIALRLSTADEVNDFQPISFAKHCLRPVVPENDFTVELDCNSRRRQREFIHEITQGRLIGNTSDLTIDLNPQFLLLLSLSQQSSRQNNPAQFCNLTVDLNPNQNRRAPGLEPREREGE